MTTNPNQTITYEYGIKTITEYNQKNQIIKKTYYQPDGKTISFIFLYNPKTGKSNKQIVYKDDGITIEYTKIYHHEIRCWVTTHTPCSKRKEKTAYHEAGHTLITLLYPNNYEFRYATIVPKPKKNTLGHVLPLLLKPNPKIQTLMYLGGYAAEQLMAQENLIDESLVGSGCDSDFEKARELLQKNSANLRKDFDLFAEEAKNLISLNKETLKQIAKRLMIEKVLNHKELKEICQQYPLKGINNPQPTFTK